MIDRLIAIFSGAETAFRSQQIPFGLVVFDNAGTAQSLIKKLI
jgi:hypothetical protein